MHNPSLPVNATLMLGATCQIIVINVCKHPCKCMQAAVKHMPNFTILNRL